MSFYKSSHFNTVGLQTTTFSLFHHGIIFSFDLNISLRISLFSFISWQQRQYSCLIKKTNTFSTYTNKGSLIFLPNPCHVIYFMFFWSTFHLLETFIDYMELHDLDSKSAFKPRHLNDRRCKQETGQWFKEGSYKDYQCYVYFSKQTSIDKKGKGKNEGRGAYKRIINQSRSYRWEQMSQRSLQRLLGLMKSPCVVLRHLFSGGLCVKSPLCHTGFDSAKQLVISSNILIDSSEVNETKLHTLFTSFYEPKVIWILSEGTGNQ